MGRDQRHRDQRLLAKATTRPRRRHRGHSSTKGKISSNPQLTRALTHSQPIRPHAHKNFSLQAGEVILRVPTDTLRSLANTPPSIIASLSGASVHAILACSLCLDTTSSLSAWRAVFPSKADIHAVLPICWPSELRALLPHTAATLLGKQSAKFQKDWAAVEAVYAPRLSKEDFLYGWLLVNTRSFYHTTRQTAKLPKEDHMVLQPVVDEARPLAGRPFVPDRQRPAWCR